MTLNEKLNIIRDGIGYLIDSQYVTYEISDIEHKAIVFYESDKYNSHFYLHKSDVDNILWSIIYLSSYFKFGTYPGDS